MQVKMYLLCLVDVSGADVHSVHKTRAVAEEWKRCLAHACRETIVVTLSNEAYDEIRVESGE